MPAIGVQYEGKLRCKATREENGQTVRTDVGGEYGGLGEYMSPVEMTVAALGACVTSVLAIVAERNGIDVSQAQTTAQFEMSNNPAHRRIGAVKLTIRLPGGAPEAMRSRLETAVMACPVKNSLHPDIRVNIEFVYG